MQIVSLQSAFHPSWAGSSDRRCPWIGGAAVHSKLPCEDAALLCSLPRSQTKSPSIVSMCCSLSRLTAQLPPHRKNLRFFLSASLLCKTHYTLQARSVCQPFPLDSPKAALRRVKSPVPTLRHIPFPHLIRRLAKTKTTAFLASLTVSQAVLSLSLPCSR